MSQQQSPITRRCRAVVITKDGKRYCTRWRLDKNINDLEPDEFPPMLKALNAAERFAKRKGLDVKQIDGQFTYMPARPTP